MFITKRAWIVVFYCTAFATFLTAGSIVAFAIGLSDYVDQQPYTGAFYLPFVCSITNVSIATYPCSCGHTCATYCVDAVWQIEYTNPLTNITKNAKVHYQDFKSKLEDWIDTLTVQKRTICYANGNDALWELVDSSSSKTIWIASIVAFAILSVVVTGAIYATTLDIKEDVPTLSQV